MERIPIRFSLVRDIPYPDILHVYDACLRGFGELTTVAGYYFVVDEDHIGINESGRVKVWLSNLYYSFRSSGTKVSQQVMVRGLLELLAKITDNSTRGNYPDLAWFIVNHPQITFVEASAKFAEYLRLYNQGQLPNRLQCVFEHGVQNIEHWVRSHQSGEYLPESNGRQSGQYYEAQPVGVAHSIQSTQPVQSSQTGLSNQPVGVVEPQPLAITPLNLVQNNAPKQFVGQSVPVQQSTVLQQNPVPVQYQPTPAQPLGNWEASVVRSNGNPVYAQSTVQPFPVNQPQLVFQPQPQPQLVFQPQPQYQVEPAPVPVSSFARPVQGSQVVSRGSQIVTPAPQGHKIIELGGVMRNEQRLVEQGSTGPTLVRSSSQKGSAEVQARFGQPTVTVFSKPTENIQVQPLQLTPTAAGNTIPIVPIQLSAPAQQTRDAQPQLKQATFSSTSAVSQSNAVAAKAE